MTLRGTKKAKMWRLRAAKIRVVRSRTEARDWSSENDLPSGQQRLRPEEDGREGVRVAKEMEERFCGLVPPSGLGVKSLL